MKKFLFYKIDERSAMIILCMFALLLPLVTAFVARFLY